LGHGESLVANNALRAKIKIKINSIGEIIEAVPAPINPYLEKYCRITP